MAFWNDSEVASIPDAEGLWLEHFKKVMATDLKRCEGMNLTVAVPCVGMLGGHAVTKALGIGVKYNTNVYDVEGRYRPYLSSLIGGSASALHIGDTGDMTKVDLVDVEGADCLMAGPPCPPWAGNGSNI